MKRGVRILVVAAAASFAAGVGVGLALPVVAAGLEDDREPTRDQVWVLDQSSLLRDRLGLSEEQFRSVAAILQANVDDVADIARAADYSAWPEDVRQSLKSANDLMERRLRSVLNDRQRALYDELTQPPPSGKGP